MRTQLPKVKTVWPLIVLLLLSATCSKPAETSNSNAPGPMPATQPTAAAVNAADTSGGGKSSILFIVDSSGSMRSKAGDTTKMDAAKEVVTGLVGKLPKEVNAGLMAYGHRQKSDCKDVELLVPVGPVDAGLFTQKVDALQPLGETPISYSIRQAADVLKSVAGKKTIILISDGEETCKEDPCAVAAELKKADVDLQIHVVGFGIDTETAKKQLHCIAESTGGIYKDAGNPGELEKVLEGLAKAAEKRGDTGTLVTTGKDMKGDPLKFSVSIYRAGTDEEIDPGADTWTSLKPDEIPPGTYDIKYWAPSEPEVWKRNVELKAGQTTTVDIGQFGRVKLSVKDHSGAPLAAYGDVYSSAEPDRQIGTIPLSAATFDLPPGTYDIRFWNVGFSERKSGIEVRPAQESSVEVTIRK